MIILQVVTIFLVAVAMALSLAHALEFPGKLRLSREVYFATQTIYYPGFTIGGFGEGLGLVAALALLLMMPRGSQSFWWTLAGFLALVVMHAIFWIVTQPVNRHWVSNLQMNDAARGFFAVDASAHSLDLSGVPWEQLRNRWEYSHIARAVFSAISLVCLTVAVAL